MPHIHRHLVCVCVCLRAKGKTILFHRRGLGDRMAIHSQRHGVCVCMAKGKTILFHRGGTGSPSTLASTHSWISPPNQKPTFPRENQKNHLLRHYAARHQKDGFFGFPRKKMVLDRKTNFFLGKRWFWTGKPTFS